MRAFAAETPGAFVEEKSAGLAWHYRAADPALGAVRARALELELAAFLDHRPARILPGAKVIEVVAKGVHKGRLVPSLAGARAGRGAAGRHRGRPDRRGPVRGAARRGPWPSTWARGRAGPRFTSSACRRLAPSSAPSWRPNPPDRDRAILGPGTRASTMAQRSPRGDVRSIWIGNVRPELDGGRFPVKREVGDTLEVTADILQEGHGALAARLRYRTVKDTAWHEVPMEPLGNDRWAGRFTPRGEHPLRLHARGVAGRLPELGRGPPQAPGRGHGRRERAARGRRAAAGRPDPRDGGRSPAARGAPRRVRGRRGRGPPRAPAPQRGGRGDPRHLPRPRGVDGIRPGARGGRGPAPRPVRRLVRAVPALPEPGAGPSRHLPGLHRAAAGHRRHGLRRGLPAADPPDRPELPQGPQQRARGGPRRPRVARGRSATSTAATRPSSRRSARWRTSAPSSGPPGITGSRSRSTSRSSARRITPG